MAPFPQLYDLFKSLLTLFQTTEDASIAFLTGTPTLGVGETIAFTDSSVATDTVGGDGVLEPGWYRLSASESCWWVLAETPTAVVYGDGSAFLKAGAIDVLNVPDDGTDYKLAAVRHDVSGYLSVQKLEV